MSMELFEEILYAQSFEAKDDEVRQIVIRELNNTHIKWHEDDIGNIICTKGEGPYPTFCCHLDTVHKIVSQYEVQYYYNEQNGDKIYTSPTGVGGDDKCGIYGCLQLLQALPHVKAIFFVQEECGVVGAHHLDMNMELGDCAYLVELDRKGDSDVIKGIFFDDTISEEFEKAILPVMGKDWSFAEGTFTDVMILAEEGSGLSTINVSCGYYNAHTAQELVSWQDLQKCIAFCYDLATSLGQTVYPHETESYAIQSQWNWKSGTLQKPIFLNKKCTYEDDIWDWDEEDTWCTSSSIRCSFCDHFLTYWNKEELICFQCHESFFTNVNPICPDCEQSFLVEGDFLDDMVCLLCDAEFIQAVDGALYKQNDIFDVTKKEKGSGWAANC